MRFRRIAAIAAAATAVLATTAAVLPGTPVDKPQPMPALTAKALAARYATDSFMIAGAASTAREAGNTAEASELDGMSHEHFIDFNPLGSGLAVEVIGNLATATRVAVLVPGSSTSLATFDTRGTASPGGGAASLAAEAHRLDPGDHLAIIAWLGYNTPSMLSPAVMTSGDAGQGAAALRPFVDYLARHGKQVALICHSYGAVVCGLAAPNLPVTDIAVVGSPGMDAPSVKALHTPPGSGLAGAPATGSSTCRTSTSSGSASARTRWTPPSARGSSPAAPAATAPTSSRAASPCATSPTSRSVTPVR